MCWRLAKKRVRQMIEPLAQGLEDSTFENQVRV